MLDYNEVLKLADTECRKLRMWSNPKHYAYRAPETIPGIESNQVKAIIKVFVQLLNQKVENGA